MNKFQIDPIDIYENKIQNSKFNPVDIISEEVNKENSNIPIGNYKNFNKKLKSFTNGNKN